MTRAALAVLGCCVLASMAKRKTGVRISRRLVNTCAKLNGLLASKGNATNESLSRTEGLHSMKTHAQGATMDTRHMCWVTILSVTLLLAGCAPVTGGRSYGYPSYGTYDPYYGGTPDPYYDYGGGYTPGYDPYYDGRSHAEEHRDLVREHEEQHEQLEHQYNKAM